MRVIDFAPPPTTLPDLSLAEGRQLSKLSVQQATGSLPGASVFQAVRDSQREGMAIGPALRAGDYKEAAAAFIRSTAAALGAIPEVHNLAGFAGIISAYHGSPHLFDEFKLEKVGTGEGAQAYGHGLYFAEQPDVATGYQQALTKNKEPAYIVDGRRHEVGSPEWDAADLLHRMTPEEATAQAWDDRTKQLVAGMVNKKIEKAPAPTGALYKVRLAMEHGELLDWDKPLSEQSPGVREKLASIGVGKSEWRTGENGVPELHADGRQVAAIMRNWEGRYTVAHEGGTVSRPTLAEAKDYAERSLVGDPTGEGVYRDAAAKADPASASAALHAAGIPGIRYLDAGSRGDGAVRLRLDGEEMHPDAITARLGADLGVSPGTDKHMLLDDLVSTVAEHRGDVGKAVADVLGSGVHSVKAETADRLASEVERRVTGEDAGTRNVVMFDPSLIKIEAVNGQPVTSPADKAADAMSVLAHPEAWGAK